MPKFLTIFTPAYNRAHTLPRLYESLCSQSCQHFIWLVVDDGSVDDTAALIKKYQSEQQIEIQYVYQANQGMHGAHNTAYEYIHTELNVCIDSDDYMPLNAVALIKACWEQQGNTKVAGIIGLDQDMHGTVIGQRFPEGMQTSTLLGYYENGGSGDKKIVYRTAIIKKYPPYPIFPGEKYVGLAYKYYLVDQDLPLLVLNEVLCIVDYQPDGSSFGMYKQYWNNPKGFAFYRITRMQLVKSLKRKFIENIHYVSSSLIANNKHFVKESPMPLLTVLAIPFGYVLKHFIYRKVKQDASMKIN